jgi:hypothetical protein|nr:MAG TPA: hypothetical protein [Caudoviricetes sp.]
MEDFELKVGDLVKLRDDLEDGKIYDGIYYTTSRYFKGFKKIDEIINDNAFIIYNDDYEECFCYTKEMIAEVKRPLCKAIYKREEPILDKKERKYLRAIIRPFRDRVKCIFKTHFFEKECLIIRLKGGDSADLPYFKENTMYKNMKIDKSYTLEELGL